MKTGLRWRQLFDIFTVFLGVMLAFWANNWKEERADRRLLQQYWQNFIEEVARNDRQLDSTIALQDHLLRRMSNYLEQMQQGALPPDSLTPLLQTLTHLHLIEPQTAAYEALKGSRAWHLFDPQTQLFPLIRYYQHIKAVKTVQDFLTTYFNQHTVPFLQKHISFLSMEGDPALLHHIEFQNICLAHYSFQSRLNEECKKLRAQGQKILHLNSEKNRGE